MEKLHNVNARVRPALQQQLKEKVVVFIQPIRLKLAICFALIINQYTGQQGPFKNQIGCVGHKKVGKVQSLLYIIRLFTASKDKAVINNYTLNKTYISVFNGKLKDKVKHYILDKLNMIPKLLIAPCLSPLQSLKEHLLNYLYQLQKPQPPFQAFTPGGQIISFNLF